MYFASLDATLEGLQQQAQDVFSRINDGRKEDHKVLSGFRETLLQKVNPDRGRTSPPFPAGNRVIPPGLAGQARTARAGGGSCG